MHNLDKQKTAQICKTLCPSFMTTHFLTITIIFCFSILKLKGQEDKLDMYKDVLQKGISDSTFIFGKWTKNGQTETQLKYLGQVTTTNGRVLKIINSCRTWGLSHRATNRILIFDGNDKYIGNYYLTTIEDLPNKLENGFLIFTNVDSKDCDKNLTTKINFTNGLPKRLQLKCQGNDGDTFTFE